MSSEYIKRYKLEVEIQDNGLIRDPFGWIIGRCHDEWFNTVVRHKLPNQTCTNMDTYDDKWFKCSICDDYIEVQDFKTGDYKLPNYCPGCGAKVVEPNECLCDTEQNHG